jgi:hypothetical protein
MGISPMYVGQRLPTMTLTINKDTGSAQDLTGASLSSILHNTNTGQDTAMTGTWTVTNATSGIATYAWTAADTATPGSYTIIVSAAIGGLPLTGDPIPFLILST